MTLSDIDFIKEQVLSLFSKNPKQMFKPIEISRRLSLKSKEDYEVLLRALHELHDQDKVAQARRKRYGYLTPESQRARGTLTIMKQGFGIVDLLPPKSGKVMIPGRHLSTGLSGDTVQVALFAQTPEYSPRTDSKTDHLPGAAQPTGAP